MGNVINTIGGASGKIDTIEVNGVAQPITGKKVNILVPTTLSSLSDDSTHRLTTDAEKENWTNKSDKSAVFTVTLLSSAWVDGVQTISDARFEADGYAYTIAPSVDSFSAWGEAMIYAEDVETEGEMTFHADGEVTEDISVNVLKVQV